MYVDGVAGLPAFPYWSKNSSLVFLWALVEQSEVVLPHLHSVCELLSTYTTSTLERKIEQRVVWGNALMLVPWRVWVVCRALWDLNIYIHRLILTLPFTHCSCCCAQLYGPSLISPGRSEGVSRATSLRPCSKYGRYGYFESQPWALEHAQKRAPLREGSWVEWVRGEPASLIASTWDI